MKSEAMIRAAERERLAEIDGIIGNLEGAHVDALKAKAVAEQIGLDELRAGLLDVIHMNRPAPPSNVHTVELPTRNVLAAAVLLHAGNAAVAEKQYGPIICEQAASMGCRSLVDIACRCLQAEGRPVPRTSSAIVSAGFSTVSLPVALGDSANKSILQSYSESPASWAGFGHLVDVTNFKTASVIRPSFAGNMEIVPPSGEVKHGIVAEEAAYVKADTIAQLIRISRQDVLNDDGGLFLQAASALGRNAQRAVADAVYSAIMENAGSYFDAGHGNLQTGGGSVLGPASLAIAIAAMVSQRDADGRDLDIVPAVLSVPPELDQLGRQLLTSESMARYTTAGTDNVPEGNPFYRQLTLSVEPRLSNTARFATASATAWYVWGPPAAAAVNVAFLDGRRVPTVEAFGPSDTVDRLAFSWRVFFDAGAALGDYRGGYKSNGA